MHMEVTRTEVSQDKDGDLQLSTEESSQTQTVYEGSQVSDQGLVEVLGRAPSAGPEARARLLDLLDAQMVYGRAQADQGSDGLFANQVISKLHASIREQDGALVLEDHQSTHGTYVNGKKIERRILTNADRVRLGRLVVRKDVRYPPVEFTVTIRRNSEQEMEEEEEKTVEDVMVQEGEVVVQSPEDGMAMVVTTRVDEAVTPNDNDDDDDASSQSTTTTSDLNSKKRKRPDFDNHTAPTSSRKRTALVAAALAGVVVGSVGTVLTLANM
ncbi:hypothetical protein BGX31_009250 [Mortierella sp. GBA43]|nr:hypothetical protein BGX31_009250 [Mortierella sp. GBA43]